MSSSLSLPSDEDAQAGPSRHAYTTIASKYPFYSSLEERNEMSSTRSSSRVAVTDEVGMISSHPVTAKAFGKQRQLEAEREVLQEQGFLPRETPVEYGTRPSSGTGKGKAREVEGMSSPLVGDSHEAGFWERSKRRARSDRSSWDYGMNLPDCDHGPHRN